MSQGKVQVQHPSRGLCSVQNTLRFATRLLTLMATETVDLVPHKSFNVPLSNISPCPAQLSKNNVLGYALEAPERILTADTFKLLLRQCREGEGLPKT